VTANKKIPENPKKKVELTKNLIFGVGNLPAVNKSCRVVPSNFSGFLNVFNKEKKPTQWF
jgi:hypothetical protein